MQLMNERSGYIGSSKTYQSGRYQICDLPGQQRTLDFVRTHYPPSTVLIRGNSWINASKKRTVTISRMPRSSRESTGNRASNIGRKPATRKSTEHREANRTEHWFLTKKIKHTYDTMKF